MSRPRSFSRGRGRRLWASGATLLVVAVFAVVFVAASGAVPPGSPSGFESADGNMVLTTADGNHTDWNCFVGSDNFQAGTPNANCKVTSGATQLTADANGEITWVNGQKFDTQCPALETGNVPNKDDFTNVASFGEIASNNDAYFYGATIRAVANGDSSGDVEFNQHAGDGTTTAGCRTAGDLLLAYDFTNGGTTLDFHILTWIDSSNPDAGGNNGTCFVSQDSMPCWGANELTPSTTEGETNQAAILAADNGISGTDLVAQQFAEFGVNLTQALGLAGTCESFPQLVWESRSSGSSFTSNPEDIEIEHKTINTCAQPTLTTQLSADSILTTGSVTDTATLAGATSDASGAITISVYAGSGSSACVAGNLVASKTASPATNGNGDYTASFSGLAAGSYEFQASIAKDAKNLSAVSACGTEPLTVTNQPTLTTQLSADSILTTGSVTDTATLAGATSDASGAITIGVYAGSGSSACVAGNLVASKTASPATTGNGDYSASFSGLAAGSYEFQASYVGDAKNLSAVSACGTEPLTVTNRPTVTTQLSADSILNTDPVTDTATLAGATSDASGAITISVYSGSDSTACDGTAVASKTASPATSGNGDYSASFSGLAAGSYEFQASYAGDAKNLSAVSACGTEPLTVQNQPSIATILSASAVNHGGKVHDSATLTGATADAGGSVTYSVYSDSSCSNKVADGGTVTVADGAVPNSNDVTFNTPGTYYWQASYSGDSNNKAAVSPCTSEQLVVAPLIDLAVTKVGSPNPITLGNGNITWTIVVTNNGPDTATGVTLADPMPAGNTFVSVTTTQGSCTGGAILNCSLGTIASGGTVTITLVTTPSTTGNQVNTVTVSGHETETNTANNTATATVLVVGPATPPVFCVAVSKVTPKQLFVGRKAKLTIHVTQHGQAVKGVHVRIKGPKINMRTKASNSRGVITARIKMKKAGILIFSPIASKRCNTKRVGVTNVFTPPVTG
jgi:uncharacterized repeat protein (TIGR01451 family)